MVLRLEINDPRCFTHSSEQFFKCSFYWTLFELQILIGKEDLNDWVRSMKMDKIAHLISTKSFDRRFHFIWAIEVLIKAI